MKAAIWYDKEDIRIEEVDEPTVGDNDVKLKVKWCGICGTDIHEYAAGPIFIPKDQPHALTHAQSPLIMGHEFSGDVVEIGKNVTHVTIGDAVVVEPLVTCGECENCQDGLYHLCRTIAFHGLSNWGGGFSEYTTFNKDFVHKLPEGVSYEMGAMVEPVSVGVHALRLGNFEVGQTALVVGAGPIGLCVIKALEVAGAKQIIATEISTARKEYAKSAGADIVLDPTEVNVVQKINELTNGVGVDISFEVTGVQAGFDATVDSVKSRGTIVVVSIWEKDVSINLNKLVIGEKNIIGTICYNRDFEKTLTFMADGRMEIDDWVTKKIHLDDLVKEGFEVLTGDERDRQVKVLVTPNRDLIA